MNFVRYISIQLILDSQEEIVYTWKCIRYRDKAWPPQKYDLQRWFHVVFHPWSIVYRLLKTKWSMVFNSIITGIHVKDINLLLWKRWHPNRHILCRESIKNQNRFQKYRTAATTWHLLSNMWKRTRYRNQRVPMKWWTGNRPKMSNHI